MAVACEPGAVACGQIARVRADQERFSSSAILLPGNVLVAQNTKTLARTQGGEGSSLMCTYCMVGDFWFHHYPPFTVPPTHPAYPYVPQPLTPVLAPWDLAKLKEFEDLLRRVKDLEDKLGCPCEPNKADYLGLLRERIDELEKRAGRAAG